ncbi:MAG: radical SAM protein [Deltaproteobacteria bacterium]|nr:radical SAM protein [Deltaproteobacteria bacterium]
MFCYTQRVKDLLQLAKLLAAFTRERVRRGTLRDWDIRASFALGHIRGILDRKPVKDGPVIATLAITPKCAMDCWHCSQAHRKGKAVDRDVMLGVIDDLVDMGTSVIAFTGGEPFMCEHLVEYIERVPSPSVAMVFSAGHGLTEEVASRLGTRSNLSVLVSIDSMDSKEHDRLRGRTGAHVKAMDTLALLKKHRIPHDVSTVVTHDRIRSGEILGFLEKMKGLGIENVQMFQPRPVGKLQGNDDVLLTQADEDWMADFARDSGCDRRYPLILNYPYVESGGVLGCCGGTYRLYMDARGNVRPCDFCPVSFGNVTEEPLEQAWRKMRDYYAYPRAECFVKRNNRALSEFSEDPVVPAEELEPRDEYLDAKPAYIYEKYGDPGYRFLIKYMYFLSAMFPKIDPSFSAQQPEREER